MSSLSLPPECIDYVIDHCHSDIITLLTCGLVCRAWYGASRYHLFTVVELSNFRTKNFPALLCSTNPSLTITIIPFLQELSLHLLPDSPDTWLKTLVSALPEYIPLRTLRIFCHGVQLSADVRQRFTTTFRSITSLALFESTLFRRSLAADVQFICSFPDLETVLFYGHHRHDLHIDSNAVILPKSVRALKLDLPSLATEALMNWLLAHEHIPVPSVMRVFRVTENSVPAFRKYLQACRNRLEDLMLFLYQWKTDPSDFDLSQHGSLKSIYLNCNGSSTLKTVHAILLSASQSKATIENVLLRVGSYELAESDDWVALNSLLTSLGGSCKTTVVMDDNGTYETEVRNRLPGCKRLDVVRASMPSLASQYTSEVYDRMKQF
ncbi:hypothetical protein Moror_13117 [Moniliophthora roreri MCA 2997]|uniref:F-box domain-containing protein n=1 Tax=Moniliophthora roreri (strain MCA 2997) TaxID=1381753 RepID=V2X8B5_MONRO|nr:hypothetical protein Moror_13117 [Moniliophthora roreri MCA 2997]